MNSLCFRFPKPPETTIEREQKFLESLFANLCVHATALNRRQRCGFQRLDNNGRRMSATLAEIVRVFDRELVKTEEEATADHASTNVQVGKFFQGRFLAVRILDEETLLACAAYVGLNPIRAAMAETLETIEFTSVQRRIWPGAPRFRGIFWVFTGRTCRSAIKVNAIGC